MTEDYGRVSMHGVRRELVELQAASAGLPLVEVGIPAGCSDSVYEERFVSALAEIEVVAHGDLFLEDVRAYRERLLAAAGKHATFPLWGLDTGELAREFVGAGFEAVLVCVDPRQLDASFAGRAFDDALLADLPAGVDPCGENGEFHTFVHAGPVFASPIACTRGEVVERDGFVFCDLLPE